MPRFSTALPAPFRWPRDWPARSRSRPESGRSPCPPRSIASDFPRVSQSCSDRPVGSSPCVWSVFAMRVQPNSARSSRAASSICRPGCRRAGRACARSSPPRRWANCAAATRRRGGRPRVRGRRARTRHSRTPTRSSASASTMRSHVGEVGRQLPTVPSVFSRLHNTLVAHGGNIVRPRASIDFDFEGELADRDRRALPARLARRARSRSWRATPASSTAACATSRSIR